MDKQNKSQQNDDVAQTVAQTDVSDSQNNTDSQNTDHWQPKKKSPIKRFLVLALLISGVMGILYVYRLPPFTPDYVETNNAYIRGKATQASPKVAGYVRQIMVQDYEWVEKGQALVQIETDQYEMKVAQAKASLLTQETGLQKIKQAQNSATANVAVMDANILSARAGLENAKDHYTRMKELIKTEAVSRQEYNNAATNLKKAEAALAQAIAQKKNAEQEIANVAVNEKSNLVAIDNAKAGLELAELELSQTLITAPISGRLSEILVKEGQLVSVGTNLMSIVPSDLWIIANIKETDIAHIAIGQPARIRVDALGEKQQLTGKVVQIAPATGSEFSANKSDPSTGNFIKVVQRIPVKIMFDKDQEHMKALSMGMSATVEIERLQR